MSEQSKSADSAERFREFVTEWERGFDALANRFMGTDEFSRAMNQFQNMQLTLQKGFAEVMAKQLAAVNLPSREDVLRVGEAVHELDMRVARMERKLEEIALAVGVEPERRKQGPPRTKRPPSAAQPEQPGSVQP
ncbi:MAG: poly(R)-hydroxyalkanoic acid synthase subunit PhaE [Pseudomonadales bacterium]